MREDIFEHCHTEYEVIQKLIEAVCSRVAGSSLKKERQKDLVSLGWIYVMEMVPLYEPERGIKFTTFIWNHLNGRLLRAAMRMKQHDDMAVLEERFCSTDTEMYSCEFEVDPYRMSPDKVYDKIERKQLWMSIKEQESSSVQACLAETPVHADAVTRTKLSRMRRQRISRLQTAMAGMI